MNRILRSLKARWGRPKHRGVSGNFSTVVIITGIVIGGYIMSGGSYPEVYPKYTTTPIRGEPVTQPIHSGEGAITLRELRMKKLPPSNYNPPVGQPGDPPVEEPPGPVLACDKHAIVFLVDVSYSMTETGPNSITKLNNVQSALLNYPTGVSKESVVGLYTFSSPNGGEPRERIEVSSLASAEVGWAQAINSINPPSNAATHMREGFTRVQSALKTAQIKYPGYVFSLVLLSDGVPEQENDCVDEFTIQGTPQSCDRSDDRNRRNFDVRHDPTDYWVRQGRLPSAQYPDIPQQIKDSGVSIYTVAITNTTDTQVFPALDELMQRISSGTSYYRQSTGAADMASIFSSIKTKACS